MAGGKLAKAMVGKLEQKEESVYCPFLLDLKT